MEDADFGDDSQRLLARLGSNTSSGSGTSSGSSSASESSGDQLDSVIAGLDGTSSSGSQSSNRGR